MGYDTARNRILEICDEALESLTVPGATTITPSTVARIPTPEEVDEDYEYFFPPTSHQAFGGTVDIRDKVEEVVPEVDGLSVSFWAHE